MHNACSLHIANQAACFIVKVKAIFTKIENAWGHDSDQTVSIAIFAPESPEPGQRLILCAL